MSRLFEEEMMPWLEQSIRVFFFSVTLMVWLYILVLCLQARPSPPSNFEAYNTE